jgi:starch synthase
VNELSVALVTREFPPEVYGGAGVHVEYLARELERLCRLEVHCFGKPRTAAIATAHPSWRELDGKEPYRAALSTLSVDLHVVGALAAKDVIHTHTWYANFAGHVGKLVHGARHVMTSHSLEPLRPWKAEQLGGGYALSSWVERTAIESADAVIAVSNGMRKDILSVYPNVDSARVHVIENGIDPEEYRPDPNTDVLVRLGIDLARPYVVFVGRITRQKGVVHLLEAARQLPRQATLVLCAGEPDTPEIASEVRNRVDELMNAGVSLIWIEKMLPRPDLIQILSHARAFVCPSVYEPFGIVNLEAMACSIPVIASAVGGIPEIVEHDQTGWLVPFESTADASGAPADPARFANDLALRIRALIEDPDLGRRMGATGRARVLEKFSWKSVALRTKALYDRLL